MSKINWGECYYYHFTKYLGNPISNQIFEKDENSSSIQILAFDGVVDECRVFCSLGLTHYQSELNERAEIFLPVSDGWSETPYLLSSALFFIINQKMALGWGMSISGIQRLQPNYTKTFGKAAIYITNIYDTAPGFEKVMCQGESSKIYLACFISESEHDFFIKNGAEKFEALLEQCDVDLYDVHRYSCV